VLIFSFHEAATEGIRRADSQPPVFDAPPPQSHYASGCRPNAVSHCTSPFSTDDINITPATIFTIADLRRAAEDISRFHIAATAGASRRRFAAPDTPGFRHAAADALLHTLAAVTLSRHATLLHFSFADDLPLA
jgi:hypothetical protein